MRLADISTDLIRDLSTARERLLHLSPPDRLRPAVGQALYHLSIAVESLRRTTTDNPHKENSRATRT